MRKQNGFTVIEAVLILVIIGIIAGTGWYVWNARSKTNNTYSSASQTISATKTPKTPTDPTASWLTYSNTDGKFSLKYPKTWSIASDPNTCGTLVLLGADSNSVGKCGADGPATGQMIVASQASDPSNNPDIQAKDGYTSITKTAVTVDGVKGYMETAVAKGQTNTDGVGYYADGTKITVYYFITNNLEYDAIYTDHAKVTSGNTLPKAYPNVLNDYNTMITKTLKFSAS